MEVPGPTDRPREFDLDPFRGVVCLWLMGMHLCWMSEAHAALLRLVPDSLPDLAYRVRLGVESFLVLAGFMAAHMLRPVPGSAVRLRSYFLRRCCRLLLPFGIAVGLAAADKWLAYFLLGGGGGRPDGRTVLAQMFLVNEWFGLPEAAVGYWTLAALEMAYLLGLGALAVAFWTAPGDSETAYRTAIARMGPVALAVVLASGAAYLLVPPLGVALPQCAFYIALGVLLYGHDRLGLYRWEWPAAFAALFLTAVALQHSRLTAALVAIGVLSALARGARFPGGRVFAALRYVGRRSYSIYLVHAIVGLRLLGGWRFVERHGDGLVVPVILAAAAASLVGAIFFYRWIERPCQELARRVRYRTSTPEPQPVAGGEPAAPQPQLAG